jgi:hypothetical protein
MGCLPYMWRKKMKIVRTQEEIDKKRIQVEDLATLTQDDHDKWLYHGALLAFKWLNGERESVVGED